MSDFIAIPMKSGPDTGAGIQGINVPSEFSGQAFRLNQAEARERQKGVLLSYLVVLRK
jgi:hypothetical protein